MNIFMMNGARMAFNGIAELERVRGAYSASFQQERENSARAARELTFGGLGWLPGDNIKSAYQAGMKIGDTIADTSKKVKDAIDNLASQATAIYNNIHSTIVQMDSRVRKFFDGFQLFSDEIGDMFNEVKTVLSILKPGGLNTGGLINKITALKAERDSIIKLVYGANSVGDSPSIPWEKITGYDDSVQSRANPSDSDLYKYNDSLLASFAKDFLDFLVKYPSSPNPNDGSTYLKIEAVYPIFPDFVRDTVQTAYLRKYAIERGRTGQNDDLAQHFAARNAAILAMNELIDSTAQKVKFLGFIISKVEKIIGFITETKAFFGNLIKNSISSARYGFKVTEVDSGAAKNNITTRVYKLNNYSQLTNDQRKDVDARYNALINMESDFDIHNIFIKLRVFFDLFSPENPDNIIGLLRARFEQIFGKIKEWDDKLFAIVDGKIKFVKDFLDGLKVQLTDLASTLGVKFDNIAGVFNTFSDNFMTEVRDVKNTISTSIETALSKMDLSKIGSDMATEIEKRMPPEFRHKVALRSLLISITPPNSQNGTAVTKTTTELGTDITTRKLTDAGASGVDSKTYGVAGVDLSNGGSDEPTNGKLGFSAPIKVPYSLGARVDVTVSVKDEGTGTVKTMSLKEFLINFKLTTPKILLGYYTGADGEAIKGNQIVSVRGETFWPTAGFGVKEVPDGEMTHPGDKLVYKSASGIFNVLCGVSDANDYKSFVTNKTGKQVSITPTYRITLSFFALPKPAMAAHFLLAAFGATLTEFASNAKELLTDVRDLSKQYLDVAAKSVDEIKNGFLKQVQKTDELISKIVDIPTQLKHVGDILSLQPTRDDIGNVARKIDEEQQAIVGALQKLVDAISSVEGRINKFSTRFDQSADAANQYYDKSLKTQQTVSDAISGLRNTLTERKGILQKLGFGNTEDWNDLTFGQQREVSFV